MPTYTVISAEKTKDVTLEGKGDFQDVKMTLKNEAGREAVVSWFTKATTTIPAAGTKLEGEVTKDEKYGFKFKKAASGGFGGGGKGKSPEEQKSIARQHAQKVMPVWMQLMLDLKVVEQPLTEEGFYELATSIMDRLAGDIRRAGGVA
jgi:hypothetical protein